MRYEEILGSDRYVQRLLDLLRGVRETGLAALDQAGSEFLVIPPDGEIHQEHFMR
jgi:hypothetical protein